MSGNASLFSEIKKRKYESVTFVDNKVGKILGIGKIGKDPSKSLENVYLVEGLKFNLLSMSQLSDQGNNVIFNSSHCIVQNEHDKSTVLYGPRIDNVYAINLSSVSPNKLSCFKASLNNTWLWHRRLGHASMHTIEKISKHDLVRGLPSYKFEKDHICDACVREKQVRSSFKPKKCVSTIRPLELLHMDLCGPITVRSLKGSSYILVIVDDYSRFTWVSFLKEKNEAFHEF